MLSVRGGEIANIAMLFERHHVRLFNYYLRSTGDRPLSEDMVQDVFLRIMKYRNTFRGDGQFLTWMFSIARNVQIDAGKRWNRERLIDLDEETTGEADPVSTGAVDIRYDAAFLQEALLKLPAAKREAVILSRFEGLKYSEIAELTGSSVENVKVRVHRAIKELRKIFFHLSGEGKQ